MTTGLGRGTGSTAPRLRVLEVAVVGAAAIAQMIVIANAEPVENQRDALAYVAGLLATLPVLLHRRTPLLAVVLVFSGAVLQVWRGSGPFLAVGLVAVPALVVMTERVAWQGAVAVSLMVLAILLDDARVEAFDAGQTLFGAMTAVSLYGVFMLLYGRDVRVRLRLAREAERRADEIEMEQQLARDAAVRAARAQIARDVHDIVAHSMSVIASRAAIGRQLAPTDPVFARESVALLDGLTSEALHELDALVAAIGAGDLTDEVGGAVVVRLEQLPQLIEATRAAGHPVDVAVRGDLGAVPADVSASAFRVVQEALTNARRHASGSVITVDVSVGDGRLDATIENGPPRAVGVEPDVSGYGLVGMRERVLAFGGVIAAEPTPTGGFCVRFEIPLDGSG